MKEVKLMILMLLAMAGSISAKDYYIAPNGSDNAAGTLEAPLATLNKIQDRLRPGDKVYFRGGVYKVKPAQVMRTINNYSVVFFLGRNGMADAPISYLAYPGDSERPVFDFSDIKPKDLRVSAFWLKGSFLHLKGFDIVGVQVTETKHAISPAATITCCSTAMPTTTTTPCRKVEREAIAMASASISRMPTIRETGLWAAGHG